MLSNRSSRRFVPLPGERTLLVSNPRICLLLENIRIGNEDIEDYSLNSNSGTVVLTSTRIIFLPATTSKELESFMVEILRVVDSYVKAPWIGSNSWFASIERSRNPQTDIWNIPKHAKLLRIKLDFKEGGAFDFHDTFQKAKERINYTANMQNADELNVQSVQIEQLPAYQKAETLNHEFTHGQQEGDHGRNTAVNAPNSVRANALRPIDSMYAAGAITQERSARNQQNSPFAPPPGYEEVEQLHSSAT